MLAEFCRRVFFDDAFELSLDLRPVGYFIPLFVIVCCITLLWLTCGC